MNLIIHSSDPADLEKGYLNKLRDFFYIAIDLKTNRNHDLAKQYEVEIMDQATAFKISKGATLAKEHKHR